MKMVSHIFVNSSVADMFIELIFNNSSSIEETVRHQPQSGERFYKLPLKGIKRFSLLTTPWDPQMRLSDLWSEAVHQQQQHWGDCETWDTSHSQGRDSTRCPLNWAGPWGGDLSHTMWACSKQIPPLEEASNLLYCSFNFLQAPIVWARSTKAALLALEWARSSAEFAKQCTEWCCTTLPSNLCLSRTLT